MIPEKNRLVLALLGFWIPRNNYGDLRAQRRGSVGRKAVDAKMVVTNQAVGVSRCWLQETGKVKQEY